MNMKNVADYTDFNGRTFKKITQTPGGASTFSLGWGNQETDYGLHKNKSNNNCRKSSQKVSSSQSRENNYLMTQPIPAIESIQPPAGQHLKQKQLQKNVDINKIFASKPPFYHQDFNKNQTDKPRTCVKIHEQKSSFTLGDNNYNYWEQRAKEEKKSNKKMLPYLQTQKTSVRVSNPPGGKSTFTFG